MSSSPKGALEKLKKSRFNTPVAFILIFAIDTALLWLLVNSWTDACLVGIIMGLVTIFGFIWLGVEEPKKILILITVMFLALAPIFSAMHTVVVYDQDYPLEIPGHDSVISEVSVDPYIGTFSTQNFNFTAVVQGSAENISMNLTVIEGMSGEIKKQMEMDSYMDAESNTTVFYCNTELGPGNYAFFISPYNSSTGEKLTQFYSPFWGPQNTDKSTMFVKSIPYSFAAIFLQIGGLSYIIAGMYWWTRVARDKRKAVMTVHRADKEEKTVKCPVCEHDIPYGTETCPYCGAEIEYEENQDSGDAEEEKTAEEAPTKE